MMSANPDDLHSQARLNRLTELRSDIARSARVRDVCRNWLESTARTNPSPEWWRSLKKLPGSASLPSALRGAGEPALSDALAWCIDTEEGKIPADSDAILNALATAAGELYADSGPDGAEWVGTLIWSLKFSLWEDFADAAASRFRADRSRAEMLYQYVERILQRLDDDPSSEVSVAPRDKSFQAQIASFREHSDFESVWHFALPALEFASLGVFEVLRRTDEVRYMRAIDALPHPWLVMQCLQSQGLLDDLSGRARLLRLGSPAFDSTGRWLPSGKASVLLLGEISGALLPASGVVIDRIPPSGANRDTWEAGVLELEQTEFRAAMSEVLDALQSRPDANLLGIHWLSKLLRWGLIKRQAPNRTRALDRPCQLARGLASHLSPTRNDADWVGEVSRMDRPYRVSALVCARAFGSGASGLATGELAQELMLSARQALVGSAESLHEGIPVLSRATGLALVEIPNFANWFTTCWTSLRHERERSWRTGHEGGWSNPAEIMVVWGLGTVDAITKNPRAHPTELRSAWCAVERVIREGRLVEPRLVWDFWGKAIARIFGYWRRVFETDVPKTLPLASGFVAFDDIPLRDAIAPYIGSTKDFMHVMASLHGSGLTSSELHSACAANGEDLATLVRLFLETAKRLEDARVWPEHWVKLLRRIESDARAL